MTQRVTLTDRENRATQMRQHVEAVAQSIITDHDGDEVFAKYLSLTHYVHGYSPRNRMLIEWQVPCSSLVAGRTAFARMAEEQGHEAKQCKSRRGKTWGQYIFTRRGSSAVWIWGPPRPFTKETKTTDPKTGEQTVEVQHFRRSFSVDVWAIEDVVYADTGEPMEAPTFVPAVEYAGLYDALVAFAEANRIRVEEGGVSQGAIATSYLGKIALHANEPEVRRIAPLLHELGHELLHGLDESLDPTAAALQEHEAEAVAAVVLDYLGHPVSMSAAYLRNWGAKSQDVLNSMDRIAKAAGEIVEFVEGRRRESVGVAPAAPTGQAFEAA